MTANFVYERISLWRTAWAELNATKNIWWRWVVAFTIIFMLATLTVNILTPITELDRVALKQHPEMLFKFFKPLIPGLIAIICIYIAAYYCLMAAYLRHTEKINPPTLSLNNFFFWLSRVAAKYLRPAPWLLLSPVLGIGLFLYYRSIFRRAPVGPLAILRQEPVLQRSWDLTKGNVWRIVWNVLVLNLLILLIIIGIILIPAIIWGVGMAMTHADKLSFLYVSGHAFFRSVSTGISIMANAIFSCTVYRVLVREQKPIST